MEMNCIHCAKVYKTVRGLTRHIELCKKKKDPIDKTMLLNLLQLSVEKVSQDECCPEKIRADALTCVLTTDHPLLHADLLHKLFCNLSTSLDADMFYREYMAGIVYKAHEWLPKLREVTATQILLQFGEKMVYHAHKPKVLQDVNNQAPLKLIEIHCIEYIGGYVIRSLRQRVYKKNINRALKDQYSSIIAACLDQMPSKPDNLVQTVTRGGLFQINNTLMRVFETIEYYFRRNIAGNLKRNKMKSISEHVLPLMEHKQVSAKMHDIIQMFEEDINEEVCGN